MFLLVLYWLVLVAKNNHKNKRIVRMVHILTNILPGACVIWDLGLWFKKKMLSYFLFSFLILEGEKKMAYNHDNCSRKMLLIFVFISGKYDLSFISQKLSYTTCQFWRYYTINCRNGFVINTFSNGTNDLVINLEKGKL